MALHAGIDTGGTFTDLVVLDDETGRTVVAKVPSTPADPAAAIFRSLEAAGVDAASLASVTVGTTVGTNALLERKGARVLLLTTAGFEDVPTIGRIDKEDPYDLRRAKPEPFAARPDCLGVRERLAADGTVVTPLDDAELERVAALLEPLLAEPGETAIAVSLLFAFADPVHERRLAAFLDARFPGVPLAVSHRSAPVWREHERTTTTVVDAFLTPVVRRLAGELESGLAARGFAGPASLLKSNGGRMLAAAAGDQAVQTVLSGLAGGIVAGRHFGLAAGCRNVITFDMGGTSADIGLVRDGEIQYVPEVELEFGLPIATAAIDLVTLGAGGGSIAWVDDGGLLRVGPQSAGAVPGPACYGLGGADATVTDANLVLGRIDPGSVLDGALATRPGGRARGARGARRGSSGSTPSRPPRPWSRSRTRAWPARSAASRSSAASTRATSSSSPSAAPARCTRPRSPRRSTWPAWSSRPTPGSRRRSARCSPTVASTGAGRTTRAPATSTSARSPPGSTRWSRTRGRRSPPRASPASRWSRGRWRCATRARATSARCRWRPARSTRPRWRAAFAAFSELHHEVYGYSFPGEPLELIHAAVTALGPGARPAPAVLPEGEAPPPRATRDVRFGGETHATPVFRRESLPAGAVLRGPAVVEELDSTTLVLPGQELRVLADGILRLSGAGPPGARREVDPVTVSVIGDQLVQIAQEMGTHMMRAAYSPIFSESRDLSCALFDRRGRMIAQGRFNPAHLGAIGETVRCVLAELGTDAFEPGDVVLHNDPFRGGCHMPEHLLIRPVFHGGELVAFAATIGHMAEIGAITVGSFAATATEVYQEGLRLPPVKLVRAGEPVEDVWKIILSNHRTPRSSWATCTR